jgi:hypothetical protein
MVSLFPAPGKQNCAVARGPGVPFAGQPPGRQMFVPTNIVYALYKI